MNIVGIMLDKETNATFNRAMEKITDFRYLQRECGVSEDFHADLTTQLMDIHEFTKYVFETYSNQRKETPAKIVHSNQRVREQAGFWFNGYTELVRKSLDKGELTLFDCKRLNREILKIRLDQLVVRIVSRKTDDGLEKEIDELEGLHSRLVTVDQSCADSGENIQLRYLTTEVEKVLQKYEPKYEWKKYLEARYISEFQALTPNDYIHRDDIIKRLLQIDAYARKLEKLNKELNPYNSYRAAEAKKWKEHIKQVVKEAVKEGELSEERWLQIFQEVIIFRAKTLLFQMEENVITWRGFAGRRKLPEKMEFDGISMQLLDKYHDEIHAKGKFEGGDKLVNWVSKSEYIYDQYVNMK